MRQLFQALLRLLVTLAQASAISEGLGFFRSVHNSYLFLDSNVPAFCSYAVTFVQKKTFMHCRAVADFCSCGIFCSVCDCFEKSECYSRSNSLHLLICLRIN